MERLKLDEYQKEAVNVKDGYALVIAGPGSGKTTVITLRICSLIKKGVEPSEIMVVTFTKKAAVSMQERFENIMPDMAGLVTFGTFHSVFLSFLRKYAGITNDMIMDEKIRYKIAFEALKESRMIGEYDSEVVLEGLNLISSIKNGAFRIGMYDEEHVKSFFRIYNRKCKDNKLIDYDDIILLTKNLFIKRPEVLEEIQNKFRYIMVDEYQDINQKQQDVVDFLCMKHNNLFVVGDDDQAIYGFRGAKSEIMLKFKEIYPMANVFYLSTNYRSKRKIVEDANVLIKNNLKRYNKNITINKKEEGLVYIKLFNNYKDEYNYILDTIKEQKEGTIAVLFRKNSDALIFLEYLDVSGFSYKGKAFAGNLYKSGIPQIVIKELKKICAPSNKYREGYSVVANLKPKRALEYILNVKGYINMAKYDMIAADSIEFLRDEAKKFTDIKDWINYASGNNRSYKSRIKDGDYSKMDLGNLSIMTMHGAKGLEFDTVILPVLNEKIIPDGRACNNDDYEEERRILYVAMTRAKEKLIMTARNDSDGKSMEVSRFLKEITWENFCE